MPIYEYRCADCGHQEEFLQKVSEAPIAACPACGKANFQKMLSAAGFHLKGSGWYATDFKSAGKKPAPKADANTEAKPEAKAEAKSSDAKTESKTESKAATAPAGSD